MSKENRENLSCLMDGELDRDASGFLMRRLISDHDMRAVWRRYHMVRACLHGDGLSSGDLAGRVAEVLAGEADPAAQGRLRPTWLRPLAGSAIAASVALVAIFGINQNLLDRAAPESAIGQEGFVTQESSLDRGMTGPAVPVSYTSHDEAARHRINTYVLRHNQAVGGAGFVSYVPIVTSQPTMPPDTPGEDTQEQQTGAEAH